MIITKQSQCLDKYYIWIKFSNQESIIFFWFIFGLLEYGHNLLQWDIWLRLWVVIMVLTQCNCFTSGIYSSLAIEFFVTRTTPSCSIFMLLEYSIRVVVQDYLRMFSPRNCIDDTWKLNINIVLISDLRELILTGFW